MMQMKSLNVCGLRNATIAALFVLTTLSTSVFAQARMPNAIAIAATNSLTPALPKGTKLIARVALPSLPVTRMYTQWEYGKTYLYLEHGPDSLTTVDISKKENPQVVAHEPGTVEPIRYQSLFEGGSIQVSPLWHVNAGVDNVGGRGLLSTLDSADPEDANLLRAFGSSYSNLADRASSVVFFASPTQLFIVQDNQIHVIDYTSY